MNGRARFLLLGLASLAAWAGGCLAAYVSLPAAEEVAAAAGLPPAEAEALRRGRVVALSSCGACHRIFAPEAKTPEEWPVILRRMGRRASLSHAQLEDLTRYLATASRAAGKP